MPSCCICKKKRLLGEVILSPRFRWLPGSSRLVIGAHQSTQTLRNFKESVKSAKSKLLVPALAVVLKRQEGHEWLLLRNPRALQWRCSPARTIGVKTNRISPVLVPSNARHHLAAESCREMHSKGKVNLRWRVRCMAGLVCAKKIVEKFPYLFF